ncbi:MAG: ribosome biogenesis GTPase YlqF [Lachnospiraceae bacterium]|nr:ribosome biogenesis GTPase YlqF [Lachnospiraceae bacterium]
MDIQWYPGHMMKAKRQIQVDIKLIDLIIELVDARIPKSGRNPDIDQIGKQKSRLILLNKSDLADERQNQMWLKFFENQGFFTLLSNARNKTTLRSFQLLVEKVCKEKLERNAKKGIKNRPLRAMIVGIPNVGKSTFINSYTGHACAKTGHCPGVTKGKQWISLRKGMDFLDTPGILWPKFDDPKVGERLAMVGSVKDEILDTEELSLKLITFLIKAYPGILERRYLLEEKGKPLEIFAQIAESRQCLVKGNKLSYKKAASILMNDFRSGKLGRITLEQAPEGIMSNKGKNKTK